MDVQTLLYMGIAHACVTQLLLLLQPGEQLDEQDAVITAEMSKRLEPLWAALSATITQIEANLPAHVDSSSEANSAAASILPPGAAQVSSCAKDLGKGERKGSIAAGWWGRASKR